MAEPRPYPIPDEDSRDFWDGARRHELVVKRCAACGFYVHYPKPFCPRCWSEDVRPTPVSGRGTVFTFSIVRQQIAPGMPPPYVVALVEIEEQAGVRLVSNIVGCAPEEVHIGMPVEVTFEERGPDVTVPQFRPVRG